MKTIRNYKVENEILYKEVDRDILCFKFTRKSSLRITGVNMEAQGFVLKKNVPRTPSVPRSEIKDLYLVKSTFFDFVLKRGLLWGHDNFSEQISNTPYDDLEKKEYSNLVYMNRGDGLVFDLERRPFPVMMDFNYINACIDNRTYDLNKLIKVLSKRKDISFLKNRHTGEIIEAIPYFNRESYKDWDCCLEFKWYPSRTDYCKVYDKLKAKRRKGWYSMTDMVLKLDLLGIKKCRY